MKFVCLTFWVIILSMVSAFGQSDSLLIKKWKVPFSAVYERMNEAQKIGYDTLQSQVQENIRLNIENATIEFKPAGVFERTYSDGEVEAGTWQIVQGNQLLVRDGENQLHHYQLQSLTATELVIAPQNNTSQIIRYIPVL